MQEAQQLIAAQGLPRPRGAEKGVQYESGSLYQGRKVAKHFPEHADILHPHGIWIGTVAGVTEKKETGDIIYKITFVDNDKDFMTEDEVYRLNCII